MGKKPKTLKSSEKKLLTKITTNKIGKHKSFEDTDDISIDSNIDESNVFSNENNDSNEDINDEPEIILNNDISLSKLKELHDNIKDITQNTKRRKIKKIEQTSNDLLDKELDISILNEVNDKSNHKYSNKNPSVEYSPTPEIINNVIKDSKMSKKIGYIEVEALHDNFDIISSFQLNNKTKDFLSALHTSKTRVPITRLQSSKTTGPAKNFSVN